jgi:tetratricopeptide (TPR) repeat protein
VKQELQSVRFNTYNTNLQLARKHRAEGLYQMSEDLYKQAIAIARVLNEPEPTLLSAALYELASYYEFQAKEDESELLWRELKAYEEYFTSNHYIYVQSIFSLAQLNEKRGKLDISEAFYEELLKKQENELGDESLDICPTLDQLAAFYCRQKKYNLAEALYLRVLVIKEFYFGTCSPEINYTVDALIDIFKKLSKWRLAEYMMNRQKAILLALHGKDSLCVASCALRLAELQTDTKQINKAIENLSFAIQVYKNKFGDLANAVISLQSKLDTLLICGMKMSFAPSENSHYTNDEPITVNLDSPNISLAVPSLVTA